MNVGLSDTAERIVSEQIVGDHCYLSEDQSSLTRAHLERRKLRQHRRTLGQGRARRYRSVRTLCFDYAVVFVFLGAFITLSQSSVEGPDQSAQLLLLVTVLTVLTGFAGGCAAAHIHVRCRRLR